jgi:hypothetical protein
LANVFGTALAVTAVQPGDATSTWQDFYLTFDAPVNVSANNQYRILLYSDTSNTHAWEVRTHSDTYSEGTYFQNEGDTNRDLFFILYTPAIQEVVYIDNLEIEAQSEYRETATFVSRAINLGVTPDILDNLWWTEEGDTDEVRVRVRFATSQGGLSSAPWSGYYTDPTGVTNELGGLTPYSWFQYEVSWINGTTADTNIIKDITLEYSVAAGGGAATVISTAETTNELPDRFIFIWNDQKGSGDIQYYISRDGKATWQLVGEELKGQILDFTIDLGAQIHVKAIITGNARLYSWAVACDKEFI